MLVFFCKGAFIKSSFVGSNYQYFLTEKMGCPSIHFLIVILFEKINNALISTGLDLTPLTIKDHILIYTLVSNSYHRPQKLRLVLQALLQIMPI